MNESQIKAAIRKHVSPWVIVFNSPTAQATLDSGQRMLLGLCVGASDLIGIRRSDGRFVAIEVKTPHGMNDHINAIDRATRKGFKELTKEEKHAVEQDLFIALIRENHGIAGFVTCEITAEELCKSK